MTTIRIRRNTAAGATASNPTLALGELGYEEDTQRGKLGDGSTAWTGLPYLDKHVLDALLAHETDDANPHGVTKAQVGLGNVDNTSDADKPVSTATLTALSGAIAKPAGPVAGDLLRYNGTDWARTTTRMFEGTGTPNGTVTAPVGSTFTNTEAGGYNGARTWRKTSGTGNMGWTVENGDTGLRNLGSALLSPDVQGSLRMRRIGGTVYISLIAYKAANGAGSTYALFTPPAGFQPESPAYGRSYYGQPYFFSQSSSSGVVLPAASGGDNLTISYPAYNTPSSAWPATLPV